MHVRLRDRLAKPISVDLWEVFENRGHVWTAQPGGGETYVSAHRPRYAEIENGRVGMGKIDARSVDQPLCCAKRLVVRTLDPEAQRKSIPGGQMGCSGIELDPFNRHGGSQIDLHPSNGFRSGAGLGPVGSKEGAFCR